MTKQPLVIITGPTAVGKTELSISLAKAINGEIISADSMQIYKYMDIGSAKITPEEMCGVTHYLVDELDPFDEFNVARFVEMAKEAMATIYQKGKIPIVVGGTGFYIQALLYDTDFSEEQDTQYRIYWENYLKEHGSDALFLELKKVDPKSAEVIHPNNYKRVIRALEFYSLHQKPISEHNVEEKAKPSPYNYCYFVLNDKRDHLYQRIDTRVDKMMEQGLLEEIKGLQEKGCAKDMVAMQGLGYKELFEYLDGELSLEESVYKIKRDTRHFAKRQLTWFRHHGDVIWVNKDEFSYKENEILEFMLEKMKSKELV